MIITTDLINQLYITVSAAFADGLGTAESQYEKIAMVVPSSSRENVYPWLGTLPSMRKWAGDRVIRNLSTHDYSIKNEKFESTLAVKRDDLEDDQVGIYGPLFRDMGAEAGNHPNRLVFAALSKGHELTCYDGQYFFDTDHPVAGKSVSNSLSPDSNPVAPWFLLCTSRPVKPMIFQVRRDYDLKRKDAPTDDNVFMRDEYLYGVDARVNVGFGLWQCAVRSTKALDNTSYAEARAAMMALTNDEGDPLGLVPNLLVVPAVHEAAARKVVVNNMAANGATNEWAGSAELLVCPWLH